MDNAGFIRIADRILADLEDRRDVKRPFQALKYDDPPIYREIQLAIGRLAYEGVTRELEHPTPKTRVRCAPDALARAMELFPDADVLVETDRASGNFLVELPT